MGFSAEWLALREPADHAARDPALLARAAQAAGTQPVIVDLGCGSGSTRRAFGDRLPPGTLWRMVDADPALLALAGGEAHQLDLNRIDALPLAGATLVTASALIDLVSAAWLEALVARLVALRLPFYAALCYDGVMRWTPALSEDADVTLAFNRHQRGDKGFGPALGPEAAEHAAGLLRAAGHQVHLAPSPWRLGPAEAALHRALLPGIAAAAGEAGAATAGAWQAARLDLLDKTRGEIGHWDLLSLPPGMGATGG